MYELRALALKSARLDDEGVARTVDESSSVRSLYTKLGRLRL